jgi:hypothetical protein
MPMAISKSAKACSWGWRAHCWRYGFLFMPQYITYLAKHKSFFQLFCFFFSMLMRVTPYDIRLGNKSLKMSTLRYHKGIPYASGGPHCRGFPYGTLREFLVDTQMRNVCYTMQHVTPFDALR